MSQRLRQTNLHIEIFTKGEGDLELEEWEISQVEEAVEIALTKINTARADESGWHGTFDTVAVQAKERAR